MQESPLATPITYNFRERLLINFSLATFLLILAQLPWPLAEVSFIIGGVVFLATLGWAVIKTPRPQVPKFPGQTPHFSWDFRADVLELDEVRFSLLLLTMSLVLGAFYALAFIRFLNAHNGLTMFFVWEGIR